jgi:hypothetical protein
MKILEFADLDTSRVKPAYRKVVAAIANGDFRAAQVRKLAGAGHGKLYRARLNDADRLIFCLLRHNDDICALMLEVIVNHDYENSSIAQLHIDEHQVWSASSGSGHRISFGSLDCTYVVAHPC